MLHPWKNYLILIIQNFSNIMRIVKNSMVRQCCSFGISCCALLKERFKINWIINSYKSKKWGQNVKTLQWNHLPGAVVLQLELIDIMMSFFYDLQEYRLRKNCNAFVCLFFYKNIDRFLSLRFRGKFLNIVKCKRWRKSIAKSSHH